MTSVKLNVGCGRTVADGWINVDKSPSVRLSALPRLRSLLLKVGALNAAQAEGFPPGVIHANAAKRLPAADSSIDFVYSSHMIEHLSRWEGLNFVREARRVLRPGGILRLATPDLKLMIDDYIAGTSPFTNGTRTAGDAFCAEYRAFANPQVNPVQRLIHRFAGGDTHQWVYDQSSIAALLREGGFTNITPRAYREGETPDLESVEHRERGLFVEATNSA